MQHLFRRLLFLFILSGFYLSPVAQTVDEHIHHIFQAYGNQNYEQVIYHYEQVVKKDPQKANLSQIKGFAAVAYIETGDRAEGEAMQIQLSNEMMENMMQQDPRMAALMNVGKSYAAQQQKAESEKNEKESLKEVRSHAAISSVRNRLGVVDSSQREEIPSLVPQPDMLAGMSDLIVDMMSLNGDMNDEELLKARELAKSGSTSDILKLAAMVDGVSEEEMLKNMQFAAKQAQSVLPDVLPTNATSLDAFGKLYDQNVKQIDNEYKNVRGKQFDRVDESIYNPIVIAENLTIFLELLKSTAWPTDKELEVLATIKENERMEALSYEQQADLFIKYLKQVCALSTDAERNKRAQFIEMANLYSKSIDESMAGLAFEDIKQMAGSFGIANTNDLKSTLNDLDFVSILLTSETKNLLPLIQITKNEYDKVIDLLDLRNINESVRFELGQLEEMAKYRNIRLNIALQLLKDTTYNFFDFGDAEVPSYEDFLTTKGADYRTKQFLLEGVRSLKNETVQQDYDSLRALSKMLGEVHLLSESEQSDQGWTEVIFMEKVALANQLKQKIYRAIEKDTDFRSFAMRWIISVQEVKSLLSPEEAFLDIYRIPSLDNEEAYKYLFTVLKKEGSPEYRVIDSKIKDIEKVFAKYRDAVNTQNEYLDSYDVFWSPVKEMLGNVKKVYLSADGVYHSIALEGLKNPETNKYVMDQTEVARLIDVVDLRAIKTQEHRQSPIVSLHLFGDPDYRSKSQEETNQENLTTSFFYGKKRLNPLEGSGKEVDDIASIASEVSIPAYVYKNEEASEEAFRAANGASIIHLATHGAFYGETGTSPVGRTFKKGQLKFYENPLLRSHIYLAKARASIRGKLIDGEDGIVTGEEVSHMQFDETQLVVLSACESGLGFSLAGEGLFGLQRAFIQAGVKNIIVTLWKVDDHITRYFMLALYKQLLLEKKSVRDAFSLAKRELRTMEDGKYDDPNHWAAFVLLGR